MTRLQQMLRDTPYQGYTYAYPHKTAYRALARPIPYRRLWEHESRDALFLYFHVPFCEMRCGFCNLFTLSGAKSNLAEQYLKTLAREVAQVRDALGDACFARFAIGGGTPTFLDAANLRRLFQMAETLGAPLGKIPISVETSPATAQPDRLGVLRSFGVTRISIGVQSFDENENARVFRPQETKQVEAALDGIRRAGFPTLNIDLMYGLPGQTSASWMHSIKRALEFHPEELFLYPLYVRPLTTLERSRREWDDLRLQCYRDARDFLRDSGYRQISMRMFRANTAPPENGPAYCCQKDGMIGLGCGARSYTQELHYSREYAVRAQGVREILAAYLNRNDQSFVEADYGIALSLDDQRRRFVLQSLLQTDGLDTTGYRLRFETDFYDDLPELTELEPAGLCTRENGFLQLTDAGIERSDAIGPWLYSTVVRERMNSFDLK